MSAREPSAESPSEEQPHGLLGLGHKIIGQLPSLFSRLEFKGWPDVACCSTSTAAGEVREYVQTEDGMSGALDKDTWRFENEDCYESMSIFSARMDRTPVTLPKLEKECEQTPSQGSASTQSAAARTCDDSNLSLTLDEEDSTMLQSQSVHGLDAECCTWRHHVSAPSFFPKLSELEPPSDVVPPADDTPIEDDEDALPGHSPESCARLVRALSDATFYRPEQTLIIFDWDDTLCPSTACMASEHSDEDLAYFLHDLTRAAVALLNQAKELASKVVIVTNAGEGWVDSCCAAWMPELQATLEDLEICSARARWEPSGVSSPTGWKAREFHNVINRFYSRYENQSWKNILAVGDAPYEHEALMRVVETAPYCRSKSVRFMTTPSIDQLAFQIRALRETLEKVVTHDGDLDIQIPVGVLDPVE
mmetsp:Transcript_124362/g.310943  ORF Transcript_124362/g.310943 Transcript_124362/m.310943 type:complete len:421 (+) Transcript_124362:93-1355(+)|eukprot:CAMPEP_0115254192 /NCGR_PEP_ID=MMETSP0270-20121206/45063_1 /TAXON_ID=71861 /ORGANISM="Scrippsiella trochoidea, Strain CCMP3099" /LENGTH=420 /DNA_ID=CAMNT_0002669725 /DNA_START=49 /DNA_END=1311 /DNA_ORIENTATION=+